MRRTLEMDGEEMDELVDEISDRVIKEVREDIRSQPITEARPSDGYSDFSRTLARGMATSMAWVACLGALYYFVLKPCDVPGAIHRTIGAIEEYNEITRQKVQSQKELAEREMGAGYVVQTKRDANGKIIEEVRVVGPAVNSKGLEIKIE